MRADVIYGWCKSLVLRYDFPYKRRNGSGAGAPVDRVVRTLMWEKPFVLHLALFRTKEVRKRKGRREGGVKPKTDGDNECLAAGQSTSGPLTAYFDLEVEDFKFHTEIREKCKLI